MSKNGRGFVCVLAIATLLSSLGYAVTPDRIIGPVDSSQTIVLSKSLHVKAQPQYDQGLIEPSFKLGYITLVISPTPAQKAALDQLIEQQQDPTSPYYHQWLTPAQYADRFGLSPSDIKRLTSWLQSQGFSIRSIGGGRNTVVFSGTAAQAQNAFQTEIHRYSVNGEEHFANSTAVRVPAALSGIVTSIAGLHNFRMKPMYVRPRPDYTLVTGNGNEYFLAPGDVATIYDLTPLYNTSIDGTGESLAVVGETDVYQADINDFRNGFQLTPISCTLSAAGLITACNTTNFKYVLIGTDPGVPNSIQDDLEEADLDLEWSGAIARNAKIIYVNAPGGNGVYDSLNAAINPPSGPPLAPVISMSYGNCELQAPDLETILQQGAAEGVTVVNSAGDSGAAACDGGPSTSFPYASGAVKGLAVNYPASSSYVTGVGGTSYPLADISTNASEFWSSTDENYGASALSTLIGQEVAWNDDEVFGAICAQVSNPQAGTFCYPTQNGVQGVRITNTQTAQEDYWISAGGGGGSNCFTSPSGVCTGGLPQPSWQSGLSVTGAPAGVRWVPDVALIASPNFPGYVFCTELSELGDAGSGSSCAVSISTALELSPNISAVGGTSAGAPVFAGIVTLLNQYLAGPASPGLGAINSTLYKLAKNRSLNGAFNKVNQVTSSAVDNKVYCEPGKPGSPQPASIDCPSGTGGGIMGFLASNADATTGYNLVTGLGSVDAYKLAQAWAGTRSTTTISISPSATQINLNQPVTFTATLSSTTALGNITFLNTVGSTTTTLGSVALTSTDAGVVTFSTTALPAGTDNVTASYGGNAVDAPSTTPTPAQVTVTQPDFQLTPTAGGSGTAVAGHTTGGFTITVSPVNGFNQTVTFGCTGVPTGGTCNFNPQTVTLDGTNSKSTSMSVSTYASMAGATTAITITASGSGVQHALNYSLTVNTPTDQSFTLAAQNATYTVSPGGGTSVTVTLTPTNGFNTPVSYSCSDQASESTCTGPTSPTTSTSISFQVTTTAPTAKLQRPLDRGMRLFYAALLPGLLGIVFTIGSRRRSLRGMRLLGLITVLGFSTIWLGSCGGSTGSGSSNPGTPAGSYTITVNATTGGANPVTAKTTFNLQVN